MRSQEGVRENERASERQREASPCRQQPRLGGTEQPPCQRGCWRSVRLSRVRERRTEELGSRGRKPIGEAEDWGEESHGRVPGQTDPQWSRPGSPSRSPCTPARGGRVTARRAGAEKALERFQSCARMEKARSRRAVCSTEAEIWGRLGVRVCMCWEGGGGGGVVDRASMS